jgi:hypothetical protein
MRAYAIARLFPPPTTSRLSASCSKPRETVERRAWGLAPRGFVVVGSNYRFTGERGRRDEWGGSDVDARNLFIVGLSRGLRPRRPFAAAAS